MFYEEMVCFPYETGGYAVRLMNWAGIFDDDGKLSRNCRYSALFMDKHEAEDYCRMKNKESRLPNAIKVLRKELLCHGEFYEAFMASIKSALDEQFPFETEEDLAKHILNRIIGEE